jgi:hypothetical protein
VENLLRSLMQEESIENLMKHVDDPAPPVPLRSTLRQRSPPRRDTSTNPVVEEFMRTVAERQKPEEVATPTKSPTVTARVDSAIRRANETPSRSMSTRISYGIPTPKLQGYTKDNYAKETQAAAARRVREPIKRIKLPPKTDPKTDQAKGTRVQPTKTLEGTLGGVPTGGSKTPRRSPSALKKDTMKVSPQLGRTPRRALSNKAPAAGSTIGNVNSAKPTGRRTMSVKDGKPKSKVPEHSASPTSFDNALEQALNEPDPPIKLSGRERLLVSPP